MAVDPVVSDKEILKGKMYVSVLIGLPIGACLVANYVWKAKNEALVAKNDALAANNAVTQTNAMNQIALNELIDIAYPKRSEQNLKKDNSNVKVLT